jgi:hypothetical protein
MQELSESLREREQQQLTSALMRLTQDKASLGERESKIVTRERKLKEMVDKKKEIIREVEEQQRLNREIQEEMLRQVRDRESELRENEIGLAQREERV